MPEQRMPSWLYPMLGLPYLGQADDFHEWKAELTLCSCGRGILTPTDDPEVGWCSDCGNEGLME